MSEKIKILEMIEQGKITAAEGMELLKAIEQIEREGEKKGGREAGAEQSSETAFNKSKTVKTWNISKNYRTLKIKVFVEKDDVNVNVNVPLNLIKIVGGIAKDVTKFIPTDAKEKIEANGVDLGSIDFDKIIRALEDGTLENPTLVDIDITSKEDGKVKVNIYVE